VSSARDEMVRRLGPLPSAIADAMRRVPRERFVRPEDRERAYEDEPLPLHSGAATISAPHMVAAQLEWLEIAAGARLLEIGSGSGYLLALLRELAGPAGKVIGVERDPALVATSRETLRELGYADGVAIQVGDGARGWPDGAPYDGIVVSCATPTIRREWWTQLAPTGRIVAPVGGAFSQNLVRASRVNGREMVETGPAVRFVPLVTGLPSDI
jgi:protein-L-isoaspartate(D-aspartate) O-methyltransferase